MQGRGLGFIGLFFLALSWGCGSGGSCPEGEAGCACVEGSRCLTGLICLDGRCQTVGGVDTGTGLDGGRDGSFVDTGGFVDAISGIRDARPNPDAFFAEDPPPMECREDGTMGPLPDPPGGTPECPDDKNREGCRCDTPGEMAPCWPGLRANRNRGQCRDGVTTCEAFDEFSGVWGACNGFVLPAEGVVRGPAACTCFSQGQWALANLSPCFITYSTGQLYAVSTLPGGGCPSVPATPPPPPPSGTWSTNTLRVDCEGRFNLCYTIKAGDPAAPSPADCVVAEVCTEGWYAERDVVQPFPDLPAWAGDNPTCARQFVDNGGYGEMTVQGLSVECDEIDDGSGGRFVFNRVPYCPLSCNDTPTAPECVDCMMGGSGSF